MTSLMTARERAVWKAGYEDGFDSGRRSTLYRVARILSRLNGKTVRPSTVARAIADEFEHDRPKRKAFARPFNRAEFLVACGGGWLYPTTRKGSHHGEAGHTEADAEVTARPRRLSGPQAAEGRRSAHRADANRAQTGEEHAAERGVR